MLVEYTRYLFDNSKNPEFEQLASNKLKELLPEETKNPNFEKYFFRILQKEQLEFENGLSVNLMLHVVCLDDELIDLTPNEVRIIEVLAQAEDQTLDFAELSDRVWHYTTDICNIRVNINNIRRKIGNYIIENIKGKGYRLNVKTRS